MIKTKTIVLFLFLLFFIGCASFPAKKTTYNMGKIFLLPPRDIVVNGVSHPKGVGSGSLFMQYLTTHFNDTEFIVITTDNNSFSHIVIASKEKALEEASRLGADYCLQLILGEARNAAPFSFRPDYVYLEDGVMYDVSTETEVWKLTSPVYLRKENYGNFYPLLNSIAKSVVNSIASGN